MPTLTRIWTERLDDDGTWREVPGTRREAMLDMGMEPPTHATDREPRGIVVIPKHLRAYVPIEPPLHIQRKRRGSRKRQPA